MPLKSIRRKTKRDLDDEYYKRDPLFQLLSTIKSSDEMEEFKRIDRKIKSKKGRRSHEQY